MRTFLINMAEVHHQLGLISHDEFWERREVALWLSEDNEVRSDPRVILGEDAKLVEDSNEDFGENASVISKISNGKGGPSENDENWIEFLCLGVWVFTKSDPDSYPSVPHGHHNSQNKKWPKLNPYTGRVFKAKHQEDISNRLSKKQMKMIWQDEKFKSFCREMVVWYQEQYPYFEFSIRRPLCMPRW
ncbi:MAG: hypothetical protein QE278_02990 [Limnobacter sp.]|nr:hypothetical protein [Limnobacter sp.]